MIDTQTNLVTGSSIAVGTDPFGVAIVPDQPPLASFSIGTARERPGVPVSFNASASTDLDGSIAGYAWAFGDGQSASTGPTLNHTFSAPGSYQVGLNGQRQRRLSGVLVHRPDGVL